MVLSSSSPLAGQIRFLLGSLNESNSQSVFQQLSIYAEQGTNESILILRSCLEHLDIFGKGLKNVVLEPLYGLLFRYMLARPNFSAVLSESLRIGEINVDLLSNLSSALDLALHEKIGLALALLDSESSDIRVCGKNYCMAQIEELCDSRKCVNSAEQIHNILMFLHTSEGLIKHVDSFMQLLSSAQFKEEDQFILAPLLSDELREQYLFRNLLDEGCEKDFDSVLEEIEKEIHMADVIEELGYGCTAGVSQCKEMLRLFSPLTENMVARVLGTIARTHSGLEDGQNVYLTFHSALGNNKLPDVSSLNSWDIDVIVDSINQLVPGINWIQVVENLDHEGFFIPNMEAFSFFMAIFRRACQDPFPIHAICQSVWKNAEGQLSFLKYAVSVPPEIFNFAHSGRQMKYADAVHGHKAQLGHANHAWLCLDLLEVLCQLAEWGHANAVRLMLKQPLEQCPEVLLLGMAHINTVYNLLQYEVCSTVFLKMLKSSGSSMIQNLWHVNPNIFLRGLVEAYNVDPDNMGRISDICRELKILLPVLDMVPSYFGIRLAAVASRRELMDLEKWLSAKLIAYRDTFFEECLKFLKDIKFGGPREITSEISNHSRSILSVYSDTVPMLMKALQAHAGLIASALLVEELGRLLATYMPDVSASGGTNNSTPSDGYTDDIEDEANSYFQKMFSGELTIDVMIQMLARLKESGDKRERSLFDCMISNLFEEYKFFPKYPEMQLKIAAVLFGTLIKHQLITHLTLGIALRGILDSLRKPPDSKLFVFGRMAIEQFPERLIEWPQYCNHILQITHLRAANPELVAFTESELAKISSGHSESDEHSASADQPNTLINSASTNMEISNSSPFSLIGTVGKPTGTQASPAVRLDESQNLPMNSSNFMKPPASPAGLPSLVPSSDLSATQKSQSAASVPAALPPSTGFGRPSRSITSARFGSALNIETLVAAAERRESPLEAPASEVQDKISFIINNLSVSNFEAKAKDFAEILKEPYYPWFAQYMVMKRASIEPNFHDLYLKFLDKVSSRSLNKEIVQATYENCKVLLGSELIKSSSEERSLLKNLGSWLGKITIGRNQVLRAREIDLKALIIEAYVKGLMIAVIPFTSKVLEPCQSSIAYRPPNPYTMGIVGLLTEIYTMPNLKMNLKFDIEVLFKNLGVDMKDVTPTSLLKDKVRQVEGNPDFSNKDVSMSQQHMTGDVKSGTIPTLNQVDLPLDVSSPSQPGSNSNMLSQYAGSLHLSSGALTEDEKLVALGISDQLPSAQGLLQRPSSFSVSQLSTPASGIDQQVVVNPKLHQCGLYIPFQSVVPVAMERAIKDIVSGIVQRSVSIATQTTKELVLKDYAMEVDETRIRNAARLMVASLAGSLAHVTCKEPLRGSISGQLRNSVQGWNHQPEVLEQAVLLVTNDNLDLGCALIEQAATDKAIQAIDGEIAHHLSLRRKQREGVGSAFYDSTLYAQGHMGFIPEALRPKPGRLSQSQQRVYEDFVRLPWQNQSGNSSFALPADSPAPSIGSGMAQTFTSSGLLNSGIYSSVSGSTGVSAMPQSLDLGSEGTKTSPSQHDSAASTLVAPGDGTTLDFENDAVSVSFSSSSAPESHSMEISSSLKVSVASSPPLSSSAAAERANSEPLLTTGDALEKYQIFSEKLETLVMDDATDADIQAIVVEVPAMILRCISRDEVAIAVTQKVFKGLYENASKSALIAAHLAILAAIRDVSKLVVKELTSWVIYSDEDRKFHKEITVGLIRNELLNLAEYNVHMAKLLDGGRNKAATEFAITLIQTLLVNDSKVISELHNLVDALAKLAARPGSPESLQQLVEVARNPAANAAATLSAISFGKEDNNRQAKEKKAPSSSSSSREDNNVLEMVDADPAGFPDQVSALFAEWYRICELPGVNDAVCAHYVLQLQQSGMLNGDDTSDRFFRCLTEIAVSHCLSSEVVTSVQPSPQSSSLSFLAIDIYAKLVFAILKFFPSDQGSSKVFLLPKVLVVTVRFMQRDADEKKSSFNPRPYFRLFINWLLDLGSMDPVYDGQILSAFANAFHSLQPLKIPGFSFAWLELVSHKSFMPKLLTGNSQKGWPYMQRLLVDLFQFLEPFLRNAELGGPVHFLYKGTLRVLLVLLHDFPEFLCDYHFSFCDVIPPSCIQMRNIILSAFPRNMRLPDPSTPNLKIDLLAEISQSPRILSEVDAFLKAKQMKGDVDEYLKTRQQGSSFLTDLKQKLLLPPTEAGRTGTRYNVPLINSLVLYVGIQAIQQIQAKPSQTQSTVGLTAAEIFQTLILDLDTEGRYLFLNAIANQLRYPNNHTHYFSFVLLSLFADSSQEIIQEQITRVLLERLIVNRPHPWGLLITFIELIKNPRYNFWSRSFTRCAPEIEKLFESVSRSCGGPKAVDEGVVSGGLSDNLH